MARTVVVRGLNLFARVTATVTVTVGKATITVAVASIQYNSYQSQATVTVGKVVDVILSHSSRSDTVNSD